MFPFMDGKGHRQLKERTMAKGDKGGTRVEHWIKGAGERKSLRWISFVQRSRRMLLSFVLEHGGEKAEMCGIDRRIRRWFCFDTGIYILLSLPLI